MRDLQCLQASHERVVFGVRELWLIQHVIQVLVAPQLIPELLHFLRDRSTHVIYMCRMCRL